MFFIVCLLPATLVSYSILNEISWPILTSFSFVCQCLWFFIPLSIEMSNRDPWQPTFINVNFIFSFFSPLSAAPINFPPSPFMSCISDISAWISQTQQSKDKVPSPFHLDAPITVICTGLFSHLISQDSKLHHKITVGCVPATDKPVSWEAFHQNHCSDHDSWAS